MAWLQRAYASWALAAGALPARRVVWGLALAFCLWVLLDVLVLQVTGGLSPASFDAMVRTRLLVAPADPRVLVVDIDEPSLKRMSGEFGRWPWPRDTLATVLDYLEQQQPAAIVWDILFSDVDRLSPGGDAAMDAAAARSRHSHFPVARLAQATDAQSQITRAVLPGLWVPGSTPVASAPGATVAVIPPALPAVAAGRLGFNNGYVDADGVLRRYRAFESLADGSSIQSITMSTLSVMNPGAYRDAVAQLPESGAGELIAWRRSAHAYPHVAFADVFAAADGGPVRNALPDFAGKLIIIGSSAAALHDIHPTPLSANQAGVDSLATVLDNAINQRHLRELPRWLDALIAVLLCLGLAYWVQRNKMASLTVLTLVLPAGLLLLSYATLNGAAVFVDLKLSAALALLFLTLLRYWNQLRRKFWCTPAVPDGGERALWPLRRDAPWLEAPLDHLIDLLEQQAGACRVVVPDVHLALFQELRWPELAHQAAIVGPPAQLARLQALWSGQPQDLGRPGATMLPLNPNADRRQIADAALRAWSEPEYKNTKKGLP